MRNMCTDDMCRPGGFQITDRAIAFCGFSQKAKLADIGCGLGATVGYLRENYGLQVRGIEKDEEAVKLAGSEFVSLGDGIALPFDSAEMDGLFFECSLSKMEYPELVLAECHRVLKHQGYLIISDLYARGKRATLTGLLGRVETKEAILHQLEIHSFTLELFEDYSNALETMWGQLIFQHGAKALCENFGTDRDELRQIKCGYCLVIARKGASL